MLNFQRWYYGIIWKINVKEILNKDCFIKFIIKGSNSKQYKDSELVHYEHVLKYEEVLRLEGLGWIEYQLPKNVNECYVLTSIEINGSINMGLGWIEYQLPKIVEEYYVQPLIEINGSINMQMDYVRYGYNKEEITYIPNIGDLLPNFYKICPNVPETFKDKYFPRKEMENLLELKDIINHL
ncbi:hypothetical protein RhiirA4_547455 [Rhizophagus irregularis]|uniref:Uncharacterized protein n=1 Tax=Rhizophagus irregularis TaxID=588596 RepID=A0A2I1H2E6_9GLOM|nr:hypothetical protein RhiirA4_547455 [Rhizophagus irregularis]